MTYVTDSKDQLQNVATPEFSDVIAKVSARLQAGENISLETIRKQYPQFETELRQVIPALEGLVALGMDDGEAASVSGLVGGEDVAANRTLGDFRIIREIGRGGMGVVYEAEQLSIKRSVALKVLPFAALVDGRAIQRFKNEVAAVATLEHPNIVSVYAVGEERGIHYYAMRLIRGQSLATVIHELQKKAQDEKSLDGDSISQVVAELPASSKGSFDVAEPTRTFDSKIEASVSTAAKGRSVTQPSKITDHNYFRNVVGLIIQAGDALHHSHQQGIIHRDVKPGNLLLDAGSQVFVTDFGLARIENAPELTMTGDFMGTLRYMSPEQVQAGRVMIDHRTDIYSLGATLYELLTLTPIWSDKNKSDLIRRISLEEPTSPRKMNPAIPVDLETILLKSLRRNPNERYATAKEFAEDLQRVLDYEPIKAKRPTTMERINKWTRRNPTIMWASAVVLVLLTIASAASALLILEQKKIASQKSEDALKESQYARAITDFVKNDFLALTSVEGQEEFDDFGKFELNRNTTLRELLDRAAFKLDARTGLDPRIEAELRWMIGENYLGMSEYQHAIEFLGTALELHLVAYGVDAEETLIAQHSLAEAYDEDGQFDKAILYYERTLDSRKHLLGERHVDTLESMAGLARMYEESGDERKALPLFERTLELRKAKLGEDHLGTLNSMRQLLQIKPGVLEEALPLLEKNFEENKAQLGEDHRDTLSIGDDLYHAYRVAEENDKAFHLVEQLLESARAKLGDDHAQTLRFMNNFAVAHSGNANAIQIYVQAAEKIQKKLGPNHPDTLTVRANLASAYRSNHQLDMALPLMKQVLKLRKAKLGEDHPKTLSSMYSLARAYEETGQREKGLSLFQTGWELSKRRFGADHPSTLVRMRVLAKAYEQANRLDEAESLWTESIELMKAELAHHQPITRSLVATVINLGEAYQSTGRYDEAVAAFEQGVEMSREFWGPGHKLTLNYVYSLAEAYGLAGQHENEVQLLEEMAELIKGQRGEESMQFFNSTRKLAGAYENDGRYDLAIRLWRRLIENRTALHGENHWSTLWMMRELAEAYRHTNRLDEAEEWLKKILEPHENGLGEESPETLYCLRMLGENYSETNQPNEAIAILEPLVELSKSNLGDTHTDTLDVRRALAESFMAAGRNDEAVALLEEVMETSEIHHGKRELFTWWCGQSLAGIYLEVNEFEKAEILLRKYENLMQNFFAHDENKSLVGWFPSHMQSMLGAALTGQKKFAEAEPYLLSGYQRLTECADKIPPLHAHCVTDSLERLVKLYDAWDQAKPNQGYDAKSKEWQNKLEEHQAEDLSKSGQ